ncbi:MAG: GNAT family N-acetyltransferase [Acidimicrobiales bacterium]
MAIVIRETDGMDEIRSVTALMAEVWGDDFLDTGICRAIQHAGGYLTGAWEGDRLLGGSLAFIGYLDGEVLLHSHATCTAPGLGSQGIGLALKWHQRRWCLDRGIRTVEWTYDPLVARNGWFNLTKLGARAVAYEIDFYGRMTTAIERGEESDRCLVRWTLDDAKVVAAAAGALVGADVEALRAAGVPVLISAGPHGGPVVGDPLSEGPALAQVALDIEALRVSNPEVAAKWRRAVRATLGHAMHDNRHLTAAARDGWYLLEPAAG